MTIKYESLMIVSAIAWIAVAAAFAYSPPPASQQPPAHDPDPP
jgi:hypothetical protein